MKAAIVGISGPELTAQEAALFHRTPPAGVILFARNIRSRPQLRALTAALRAILPEGAALMVDQEGGRVARLRPPDWRAHPPMGRIGALHAADPASGLRAAWLTGALIGAEAAEAGFSVVAAPVLDRALPGAHDVIGDRSFGADPAAVASLGRACAEGLLAAGIQPVGKHVPGHGRAQVDSHLSLPVVKGPEQEAEADLLPFAANASFLPWLMTAHILYPAWDEKRPATLSATIIGGVVRGKAWFGGVLVSDDLAMGALSGSPAERTCAALAAGCDLALFCTGEPAANAAVLEACPDLTDAAAARLARARRQAESARIPLDVPALAEERDRLMAKPVA